MVFSRVLFRLTIACLATLPVPALAQNQAPAVYDVSSVKPHEAGDQMMSWRQSDDGFLAVNVDLKNVMADAWGLRADQVTGEPAWAGELRWDVTGKSLELTPEQMKALTPGQRHSMLQQLLAERFHLAAHLEMRTGPVLTVVPAKGGIKLQPIAMTAEEKAAGRASGTNMRIMGGPTVTMEGTKVPLSMLIANLALNMHQTLIDNTGLTADAVYTFTLRWARDTGTGTSPDSDAPPLPAALGEELGLHLEASRGPVQVLVVDHVEKPAAN